MKGILYLSSIFITMGDELSPCHSNGRCKWTCEGLKDEYINLAPFDGTKTIFCDSGKNYTLSLCSEVECSKFKGVKVCRNGDEPVLTDKMSVGLYLTPAREFVMVNDSLSWSVLVKSGNFNILCSEADDELLAFSPDLFHKNPNPHSNPTGVDINVKIGVGVGIGVGVVALCVIASVAIVWMSWKAWKTRNRREYDPIN